MFMASCDTTYTSPLRRLIAALSGAADVDSFECTRSFNRKSGKLTAPPSWAAAKDAADAKKVSKAKGRAAPAASPPAVASGSNTGFSRCV